MVKNLIIAFLSFLVFLSKFKIFLCFLPIIILVSMYEKIKQELNFLNLSYFTRRIRTLFQSKIIKCCQNLERCLNNKKSSKPRRKTKKMKKIKSNMRKKDFSNFILKQISDNVEEQYFCDCPPCRSVKINKRCSFQKCKSCTESKFKMI